MVTETDASSAVFCLHFCGGCEGCEVFTRPVVFLTNQIADREFLFWHCKVFSFLRTLPKVAKLAFEKSKEHRSRGNSVLYGGKFQKCQEWQIHHIFYIWHSWIKNFAQNANFLPIECKIIGIQGKIVIFWSQSNGLGEMQIFESI